MIVKSLRNLREPSFEALLSVSRWGMISSPYHYPDTELSLADTLSLPIGLYIAWQCGYWVVTEILLR